VLDVVCSSPEITTKRYDVNKINGVLSIEEVNYASSTIMNVKQIYGAAAACIKNNMLTVVGTCGPAVLWTNTTFLRRRAGCIIVVAVVGCRRLELLFLRRRCSIG
jgi:hypothetical protein